MALRKGDLDELNRPPRRVRALPSLPSLPSLPMAAGAEEYSNTGNEDAEMSEPTMGEILLARLDKVDSQLDKLLQQQGQTTREMDAIRRDVTDLKDWRTRLDQLPEKREDRQARQEAAWWQTTNGRINLVLAALVVLGYIIPVIQAHWH